MEGEFGVNATYEETDHRRELEHAQWRVSFVEFLLQTHRRLLVKDEAWQHDEKQLVERLSSAKEQLQNVSRD